MEKETEKGREAKRKGKICGFDAGISPWGMAGWLALAGTGIRSAFRMFAMFPKTSFRAIPRQQSRTNWEEGRSKAEENNQKRRNHGEREREREKSEWNRREWIRRGVKRRVISEVEEERRRTMRVTKKWLLSVLRIHPSIRYTHAHTQTHTHTHTIGQTARRFLV